MISKNVEAVALMRSLNNSTTKEQRSRVVRDILSAVIDGWDEDNPVFGAVTSDGVVFETPLNVGGFAMWNSSESVQVSISLLMETSPSTYSAY